jgi:hypothetical protein
MRSLLARPRILRVNYCFPVLRNSRAPFSLSTCRYMDLPASNPLERADWVSLKFEESCVVPPRVVLWA